MVVQPACGFTGNDTVIVTKYHSTEPGFWVFCGRGDYKMDHPSGTHPPIQSDTVATKWIIPMGLFLIFLPGFDFAIP